MRASETTLEAPFHISHRFTSADGNYDSTGGILLHRRRCGENLDLVCAVVHVRAHVC